MNLIRTTVMSLVAGLALTLTANAALPQGKKGESKPAETKTEKKKEGAKTKMATPQRPVVVIETSKGTIEAELYDDKAPVTVANFLKYVEKGHYANTIFHRVIPNFMIQGGGMGADMSEKPSDKGITNEADNGMSNRRGTLAMARTSDPHSASAQFFINTVDNPFLDHTGKNDRGWGYAVFGEVKSGLDVVDAIKAVKTATKGPHENVPVEPVVIKSIKKK